LKETIMIALRRKKGAPKNLDTRLETLRSEIDALQNNIKDLASDAGDVAGDRAKMAVRAAEAIAERAYRLAQDSVGQKVDDVEAWANDNLDNARDQIREQPISAFLISLGIGAILGAILLR
jgi:ElaB/YqjD/DUF883 family membrane-anchored ribosome-binding protein